LPVGTSFSITIKILILRILIKRLFNSSICLVLQSQHKIMGYYKEKPIVIRKLLNIFSEKGPKGHKGNFVTEWI
jgi:hypothetical protein